jgi:antibiotic biosynthesis monooxygenase (ABM) superfamily enzyme
MTGRAQSAAGGPATPGSSPWLLRLVMTLAGWIVAFLIVIALLSVLKEELASLPLALRALVISGVLVAIMVNAVMPVLSAVIPRWLAGLRRRP